MLVMRVLDVWEGMEPGRWAFNIRNELAALDVLASTNLYVLWVWIGSLELECSIQTPMPDGTTVVVAEPPVTATQDELVWHGNELLREVQNRFDFLQARVERRREGDNDDFYATNLGRGTVGFLRNDVSIFSGILPQDTIQLFQRGWLLNELYPCSAERLKNLLKILTPPPPGKCVSCLLPYDD